MANRTIYPLEAPTPPHWRGVSDLAGYVGDLFYGAYDRSTNFQVHNATSVAKRRGFVRALNEKFPGHPAGAFCREKGRPVQVLADGVGVKVLSSVPPIIGGGGDPFDDGDGGFVDDTFDRADNNGVNATGEPWAEQKGVEPYDTASSWAAGTAGGSIKDRELRMVATHGGTTTANTISACYLDKVHANNEPTSLHVIRAEIDLGKVLIAADAAKFSLDTDYGKIAGNPAQYDPWSHAFCLGMGLPGRSYNAFNNGNEGLGGEKDYGALNMTHFANGDFNGGCPWSGIGCRVQFKATGDANTDINLLRFAIRMHTYAFLSNHPEGYLGANEFLDTDAIQGKATGMDSYDSTDPGGGLAQGIVPLDDVYEVTGLTYTQLQTIHTLEFGRVATEDGFLMQSKFWRGKTFSAVSGSVTPDIVASRQFQWGEAVEDGYIVRANEIKPSAGADIETYSAVSGSWLQPDGDIGTPAITEGMRCSELQVEPRFM